MIALSTISKNIFFYLFRSSLVNFTKVTGLALFSLPLFFSPYIYSQELEIQNIDNLGSSTSSPAITIDSNVFITMRDGINISVDIYRPSTAGTYPTLYAAAPYPHDDDETPPNNSLTGPVSWYVSQGYNYVIASSRGTGLSEGNYEFLSREEQQDHYEIIEWIALQEWSNGKVAGIGASYYATSQWQMAVQNPPHLECIAPYNGVVQPYQDWAFPGGLSSEVFSQNWYKQLLRQANAFPATGAGHILEYDIDLQLLLHPRYDDYWRIRSSLESIDEISVPVFVMRNWNQNEPGLNGTFKALEQLNSTHKILISGTNQGNAQYQNLTFLQEELLPFYDWCLNDRSRTSFIEQPRIRYYVRGQDQIKRENSWPPGNTIATPLFLNRQQADVDTDEPDEDDQSSLNFTALTNNISFSQYGTGTESFSLRFISEVLEDDLEITGPIKLELYASSSATDTAFEINLSERLIFRQITQEQAPISFLNSRNAANDNILTASTDLLVSTGTLKASLRNSLGNDIDIDSNEPPANEEQPSTEEETAPIALTTQAEPLDPNEVTRFDITLQPTAYRFKRGNRIVVDIRKSLDGSLLNKPSQEAIFHNGRYPTRLWLPLVQTVQSLRNSNDEQVVELPDFEDELPSFDFLNTESLEDDNQSPIIFVR